MTIKKTNYKGLLIVVEGTDGTGKSTQINLLKRWLENNCYATKISKGKTSKLISNLIDEAKQKNLLTPTTFSLLYALDFADRLENQILPALKAGFIVLLDKYIYNSFVRDTVRRHDINWIKKVYEFAPKPDIILYLDVPLETILKRMENQSSFDYYESGLDMNLDKDPAKSFLIYQEKCIEAFSEIAKEFNFVKINGDNTPEKVHELIKQHIQPILDTKIFD